MGTSRPRRRTQTGVWALSEKTPALKLYGRRKGRPLRARKSWLMQEWLPRLAITLPEKAPLDPYALFAPLAPRAIQLEIGFGGGEHLAAQAAAHPDTGFIGAECFINGVASLLDHVEREKLSNLRLYPGDARMLLDALPPASLTRAFLLFPDPWPKARHAERRFINPDNLARFARVLEPGAELRIATDHTLLAEWMRGVMHSAADFSLLDDTPTPPPDWIPTRYEQKALKAGRPPVYMRWERK